MYAVLVLETDLPLPKVFTDHSFAKTICFKQETRDIHMRATRYETALQEKRNSLHTYQYQSRCSL